MFWDLKTISLFVFVFYLIHQLKIPLGPLFKESWTRANEGLKRSSLVANAFSKGTDPLIALHFQNSMAFSFFNAFSALNHCNSTVKHTSKH